MKTERSLSGGTGTKLADATIILAGLSSLIASLLSSVSIWHQAKNYRKPLLQRYVIRILLMVPIYSLSSWSSIISPQAANIVEPIRDIYEAFTIYTFFQLLINFIGGERALIIMMHGREPVHHLWPLTHCLAKVDISDPHTFLAIKRGILQYAWLKPVLGFTSVIMKATGIYKEGYLGLDSGYLWSGIAYNLSVTVSLYSLGLFWVCMSKDLQPFRPVPKFLCIKLIIFASYWQGFFLSILVWLKAIPDNVEGYTSDNLASAIQDALICMEMPIFAMGHWYAFSWHDYADITISAARMPIKYALRDALGIRDLIEDTKETFSGNKYEYRLFDSGDNVLAHEGSSSRVARMMEGMRYERNGKRKYWIPKPGENNARTPLLQNDEGSYRPQSRLNSSRAVSRSSQCTLQENGYFEEQLTDSEEEGLYVKARALEYGDWNYPVITAHEASRDLLHDVSPALLTTSANRHLLQPTSENQIRRANNLKKTVEEVGVRNNKRKSRQGKRAKKENIGNSKTKEASNEVTIRAPALRDQSRHRSSSSSSTSDRTQLVDLVVEDVIEEDIEKIRAKKEGGPGWNTVEPKRFVRTYGENTGEDTREGFEPTEENDSKSYANVNEERATQVLSGQTDYVDGSEESRHWREELHSTFKLKPKYGLAGEAFENVWSSAGPLETPKENP